MPVLPGLVEESRLQFECFIVCAELYVPRAVVLLRNLGGGVEHILPNTSIKPRFDCEFLGEGARWSGPCIFEPTRSSVFFWKGSSLGHWNFLRHSWKRVRSWSFSEGIFFFMQQKCKNLKAECLYSGSKACKHY